MDSDACFVPHQDRAPPKSVTIDLPSTAEAASIARQFVESNRDHLRSDLIDDAKLLVSEIVTNAVLYGQPGITLALRVDPPCLGVIIVDEGPNQPQLPEHSPGPENTSGRGLLIVDALASSWGVIPATPPPGKAVWFSLIPRAS